MQAVDPSGSIGESAFRLLRVFLEFVIFIGAVAASRWGIRKFLLNREQKSSPWRTLYWAVNLVVLVSLLLLRGPAEKLLTALGDAISSLRPNSELGWLSAMLVGIYYALMASSILLLAIQAVGLVHWFADRRIDAWQARLHVSGTAVEADPRFHASKLLQMSVRLLRDLLVAALIGVYFFYGFATFPRTRIISGTLRRILGPPIQVHRAPFKDQRRADKQADNLRNILAGDHVDSKHGEHIDSYDDLEDE